MLILCCAICSFLQACVLERLKVTSVNYSLGSRIFLPRTLPGFCRDSLSGNVYCSFTVWFLAQIDKGMTIYIRRTCVKRVSGANHSSVPTFCAFFLDLDLCSRIGRTFPTDLIFPSLLSWYIHGQLCSPSRACVEILYLIRIQIDLEKYIYVTGGNI